MIWLMQALHLIAAVAWIGGIVYTLFILMPALSVIPLAERRKLVTVAMRRFLTLVWSALALLLLTGLHRVFAVQQMTTRDAWFGMPYGHVLMTKLLLVLGLVGIAALLTGRIYPQIRNHDCHAAATGACSTCAQLTRRTHRLVRIALILGVLILLLAAKLRVG